LTGDRLAAFSRSVNSFHRKECSGGVAAIALSGNAFAETRQQHGRARI